MCLHVVCVDQSRQNIYRLTTVEKRKNPRSNQTSFCCQQQISCVQRKLFNAKKHGICSTSQSFLQHVACPVRWAGYLFLFLSLQIRRAKICWCIINSWESYSKHNSDKNKQFIPYLSSVWLPSTSRLSPRAPCTAPMIVLCCSQWLQGCALQIRHLGLSVNAKLCSNVMKHLMENI